MQQVKVCSKCIMDSHDDPALTFDLEGVCHHCTRYDFNVAKYYHGGDPRLKAFHDLIKQVKKRGEDCQYDAVIGLSGGVDSTFVAYLCWKYGLRVLAVHLDNGWNSEISVLNIKNILKTTGFDLFTYVINWNEFRDLQRSYFKAHVVDIEALTDHAIITILIKTAKRYGIKTILTGISITTEGRLPNHWVYNKWDYLNIKSIHARFGKVRIKSFPHLSIWESFFGPSMKSMNSINMLDYYPYDKAVAKEIIKKDFGWEDYGGKHYESIFTRFYQGYILPRKFGIDKRKSHYSTLICAGQLKREEALLLLKDSPYRNQTLMSDDYEFVKKKLQFSDEEFEHYMNSPRIEHTAYMSVERIYDLFRPLYRFVKYRILWWKQP